MLDREPWPWAGAKSAWMQLVLCLGSVVALSALHPHTCKGRRGKLHQWTFAQKLKTQVGLHTKG